MLALFVNTMPATAQSAAQHARVELLARQASVKPGSDLRLGVHFILKRAGTFTGSIPATPASLRLLNGSCRQALPPVRFNGRVRSACRVRRNLRTTVITTMRSSWSPSMLRRSSTTNSYAGCGLPWRPGGWSVARSVSRSTRAWNCFCPRARSRENSATAKLFAEAEKQLPIPMPQGWKARAESRKDDFLLTVAAGKPITKAIFFPWIPDRLITLRHKNFNRRRAATR